MSHEPACTGTKRCSTCGEDKHVLAFATDRTHADGLRSICRHCEHERNSERYHQAKREGRLPKRDLSEQQREYLDKQLDHID